MISKPDDPEPTPSSISLADQRKFIAEIAEAYSEDRLTLVEKIEQEIQPVLSRLPNKNVLELGAGAGAVTLALKKSGYHVVAVEIVREMIRNAPEIIKPWFVRADGIELPFKSHQFGAVFIWGNTLGPIPGEQNRSQLLIEAKRVLIPGGILAVNVLNRNCSLRRMFSPREYLFHYHSRQEKWKSTLPGYNKFFTFRELRHLLHETGYKDCIRVSPRFDASLTVTGVTPI